MTTGLRPRRVIYKFPLSSPTSLLSPNSNSSCRPRPSRLPLSGERLVSWSCWVQGECYLAVLMRSEPRAASWHRDGVSRERLGWGVSGLGKLAIRGGATILSPAAGPSRLGTGATRWVLPHITSLCSCLDSLMTSPSRISTVFTTMFLLRWPSDTALVSRLVSRICRLEKV